MELLTGSHIQLQSTRFAMLALWRDFRSLLIKTSLSLSLSLSLSHLKSLPLSLLLETLPSVFKNIQRKTKLSSESRTFTLQTLYQLQNFPKSSRQSYKIPNLLDLKPRPSRKHYFDSVFRFLDNPRPKKNQLPKSLLPTPTTHSNFMSKPATKKPSTSNTSTTTTRLKPSSTSTHSTLTTSPTRPTPTTSSTHLTPSTSTTHPATTTSPTHSAPTTSPIHSKPYFPQPETQISVFHRKGRSTTHWTLPALKDKTVFIGDSNLSRLQRLPDQCHAFSFGHH